MGGRRHRIALALLLAVPGPVAARGAAAPASPGTHPEEWLRSGADDAAIEAARPAMERTTDPVVAGTWARLLALHGRHEEIVSGLERFGGDLLCRTRRAEARIRLGDRAGGRTDLLRVFQDVDPDGTDPRRLTAAARAARELGDFQAALDLATRVQSLEPGRVEARVLAGELFLEKYQLTDALTEFDAALALDAASVEAGIGRARALLEKGDLKEAREAAGSVIERNRRVPGAWVLIAAIDAIEEDFDHMKESLDAALAVDPRHEEALCRLAVHGALTGNEAQVQEVVRRSASGFPGSAVLAWSLGEAMSKRRDTEAAGRYFRQALETDPGFARAAASLGGLHLREGDEVQARQLLERAFALDGFDYRTLNFLKILDRLDQDYATWVAPTVTLRLDREREGFLAPLFLGRLEGAFRALCQRYRFQTTEPVLVEIHPRHDWFAGRITGLPWIGITGACFGRVVVADSPQVHPGTSNRHEVMRHELVHAVNLQQTRRRLPMWLAEGLATWEEAGERSRVSWQLLKRGLALGTLRPLSGLNAGFTRPGTVGDRQLAYHQAGLAVDFLVRRFGFDAMLGVLQALERGERAPDAFTAIYGVPAAQLDAMVLRDWERAAREVPVRPLFATEDLELLESRAAGRGIAGRLDVAWAHLAAGRPQLALRPLMAMVEGGDADRDPALAADAHALMGDLLRSRRNASPAREHYRKAQAIDSDHYHALMGLATLALGEGDIAGARQLLERVAVAHPREVEPRRRLVELAVQRRDPETRIHHLEAIVRLDRDDGASMLELLELRVERGEIDPAASLLDALVLTDTFNPRVHELAARVHEARQDPAAAQESRFLAVRLDCWPYKPGSRPGDGLETVLALLGETSDPTGRRAAVHALGTLACPPARTRLETLLVSADPRLRHEAALALRDAAPEPVPSSVPVLIEALGCPHPPRCGERAWQALRALSGRDLPPERAVWEPWWTEHRGESPEGWLLAALRGAGVDPGPAGGHAVLVEALAHPDDVVAHAAWSLLVRRTRRAHGRGLFDLPPTAGSSPEHRVALTRARREAIDRWQLWLRAP